MTELFQTSMCEAKFFFLSAGERSCICVLALVYTVNCSNILFSRNDKCRGTTSGRRGIQNDRAIKFFTYPGTIVVFVKDGDRVRLYSSNYFGWLRYKYNLTVSSLPGSRVEVFRWYNHYSLHLDLFLTIDMNEYYYFT
jgi:hypothetical protein